MINVDPSRHHYDESKTISQNCRQLQYAIALNDVHNFWLPLEKYKSLLKPAYLSFKMPFESEEMNCITPLGDTVQHMSFNSRFNARERIDVWKEKNYSETVQENVKILDDYLTLCEENNVRSIIFTAPMTYGYMKYFSKKKLDEFYYLIREAQKKHTSSIFFDSWKLPIFPDEDFWDVDHLNIQGAAKFSTILNEFIEGLEK